MGMHRTAEYGIAAHWKYKETNKPRSSRRHAGRRGPAVAAPAAGLAAGDPGAGRVPRVAALRPRLPRGVRLHAEGRRDRAAVGLHPGRLRVRGAHRGRPPLHRRPGQRPAGGAGVCRWRTATRSRSSPPSPRAPARPGTGCPSSASPRAKTKIRQWFAKERREDAIESGKDSISRAMRKAGLPLQRLLGGDALVTMARDLRYTDVTALYAAVGEGHVSATSVVQKIVASLGGSEGAVEDIAETADAGAYGTGAGRPATRASVVKGGRRHRHLGQARQVLHPGAGRRHPRLRDPRRRRLGAPQDLHERRRPARRAGAHRRGRVGAVHRLGVPGRDPGRGAGPAPAALGRDPRRCPTSGEASSPRP